MPLLGTLDTGPRLSTAPRLDNYDTEAWELAGAELLSLTMEIDHAAMVSALPVALHPTIPPVAYFTVTSYPDSPAGPFNLAQVRVSCRASALPRGFLLRAFCDSTAARDELGRRWGFDCHPGEVLLRRYHDRIVGSVLLEGREVLNVSLLDPQPISGASVFYVSNMNLARVPESEGDRGVLVQVDPAYTFHRCERGSPRVSVFDRAAWAAEGVDPVWPVTATFSKCDTGFPRIRYVVDPGKLARLGTRKLRDTREN